MNSRQARRKGRWHVKESGVVWDVAGGRVDWWWKDEVAPGLEEGLPLKSDSSECGLPAVRENVGEQSL